MNLYSASCANTRSATRCCIKDASIASSTTSKYIPPSLNYSIMLRIRSSKFSSVCRSVWVSKSAKGQRTIWAWTTLLSVVSTVLFTMHLSVWWSTPRLLDTGLQWSWTETSNCRDRDLCRYWWVASWWLWLVEEVLEVVVVPWKDRRS